MFWKRTSPRPREKSKKGGAFEWWPAWRGWNGEWSLRRDARNMLQRTLELAKEEILQVFERHEIRFESWKWQVAFSCLHLQHVEIFRWSNILQISSFWKFQNLVFRVWASTWISALESIWSMKYTERWTFLKRLK